MVFEESVNLDQTLIKIITTLQHSTDERIMADVPELEWRDFFGEFPLIYVVLLFTKIKFKTKTITCDITVTLMMTE